MVFLAWENLFLFDFYLPDGLDFLHKVKSIIEQGGKFPAKVAKGWNYHKMKDITGKFAWIDI